MTTYPGQKHGIPPPAYSEVAPSQALPAAYSYQENVAAGALRLLRKHLVLLLACLLAGLATALLINTFTPREYTARANIQVTQDSANQFRLEQAVGGDIDGAKIDTDMEVLRSSTLALQTIRSMQLSSNQHFIAQSANHSWDTANAAERHILVSIFASHLTTTRLGHTNIVQLSVTSSDPKLAADICNELIKNYREHNFKDNYTDTEEVSNWLQAQLGELKQRLEASQEKLLQLQRDIGLIGIDQSQSVDLIRLEALNRNRTQAEADRLVLQAKLLALKTAPAGVVDTLSADPLLLQLRQRKAQLADEYAGLMSRYGSANPRVVDAGLQLNELAHAVRVEEANAIQKVEKEYSAAVHSESALRTTLEQEQEHAYSSNSKVLTYSLARREYEADRTLYDGLQAKLQEAGIIAGLHSSSIRVVDAADVPGGPSKPRKAFNVMAGLLAGMTLGIMIALLLESLDTYVRTISDVEDVLGLPLLGVVPRVGAKELITRTFIESATQSVPSGWSHMAEAYRSLRTSLLLSRPGTPPQVIMVSSSQPADGKTSVASFESILLAISGARVLLVDADLRKPSVHTRFGIPNSRGLSSILTSRATINESLCKVDLLPLLSILPAGPLAPMPAELLGSTQMRDLLLELRARFDFIVIDTPPALTVTDAAVLASLTDGVIVILRYGHTRRNAVARTSLILNHAGARTLGVVINAADYKSPDYADYYGGYYQTYQAKRQAEQLTY